MVFYHRVIRGFPFRVLTSGSSSGNPALHGFAVPLNQKARFSADGEAFWGFLGGDSLNRTGLLTSGPASFRRRRVRRIGPLAEDGGDDCSVCRTN
jgi:hypothetical protein